MKKRARRTLKGRIRVSEHVAAAAEGKILRNSFLNEKFVGNVGPQNLVAS